MFREGNTAMKLKQIDYGGYTIVYEVTEYKAVNVAQFIDELLRERPNDWGDIKLETPKGVMIPEFKYYKGGCDSIPSRKRVYANVNGKMMWGEAPLHLTELRIQSIKAAETEYRGDVDYYIKYVEKRHEYAAPNLRRVDEPTDPQERCELCRYCYMDFASRKYACSKYLETFTNPHRWTCDDLKRNL